MRTILQVTVLLVFFLLYQSFALSKQEENFNKLNKTQATALSAGDLVITVFNSDGNDGFAFMPLVDVDSGTVIKFTDEGWDIGTSDFTTATEGTLTWTATSDISQGTEIQVTNPTANPPTPSSGSMTRSGTWSLTSSGDQILVYQGDQSSPTFIYCINTRRLSGNAWNLSVSSSPSNNTNIPAGLDTLDNAFAPSNHVDNLQFICNSALNDTPGNIRALFLDESNYNTTNTTVNYTTMDEGGCSVTVPVELTFFSANIFQDNVVELNWNTATEVNNYGFSVERRQQAADGRPNVTPSGVEEWEAIGFVLGHGNSNSPKDYSFVDENVIVGKYYYRLKQIDFDGTFEYSHTVEISLTKSLLTNLVLKQNYPNPFNPSTVISYQLSETSSVELTIYDALGKEIKTLINEKQEAGSYSYNFNGKGLSSGTYIYKLQTDDLVETKKMLLMK